MATRQPVPFAPGTRARTASSRREPPCERGRRTGELPPRPADIASTAYTKDLLFSQSANERGILRLVEEALRRIDAGDYGVCANCEEEIQDKRLEAVPWARHCIKCQDLQERGLLEVDTE